MPRDLLAPKQPRDLLAQPTLDQRVEQQFGMKPDIERPMMWPLPKKTDQGVDWKDWTAPGWAYDMVRSASMPGHVMQGGDVTPRDMMAFTMDYALPAVVRSNPAGPASARASTPAPTTEQLKAAGGAAFEAADRSGLALSPNKYLDFMANLETEIGKEGVDSMLHPKVTAVMSALTKRIGKDVDIGDLKTIRRQMGIAARSTAPELADERRIADIMIDRLDDMIDNLADADVVAGDKTGVADKLKEARSLWARGKKSELVEKAISTAKEQASGFENGIRIEFRKIVKSPKLSRGFSADELQAMKDVIAGTPSVKAMRLLGKMSPYKTGATSLVGPGIGAFLGGSVAGGPGAVALPALGYLGQKGAEKATEGGADMVRALIASGGRLPAPPPGTDSVMESIMRAGSRAVPPALPPSKRSMLEALMNMDPA